MTIFEVVSVLEIKKGERTFRIEIVKSVSDGFESRVLSRCDLREIIPSVKAVPYSIFLDGLSILGGTATGTSLEEVKKKALDFIEDQ